MDFKIHKDPPVWGDTIIYNIHELRALIVGLINCTGTEDADV
jgi:hypothetical protein